VLRSPTFPTSSAGQRDADRLRTMVSPAATLRVPFFYRRSAAPVLTPGLWEDGAWRHLPALRAVGRLTWATVYSASSWALRYLLCLSVSLCSAGALATRRACALPCAHHTLPAPVRPGDSDGSRQLVTDTLCRIKCCPALHFFCRLLTDIRALPPYQPPAAGAAYIRARLFLVAGRHAFGFWRRVAGLRW